MHALPDEAAWPAHWHRRYAQALALGGHDTRRRYADENLERPVRLIAEALRRLVVVGATVPAICSPAEARCSDDSSVRLAARLAIAGALRLTHTALEVHARDLGYATRAWLGGTPTIADAIDSDSREQPEVQLLVDVDEVARDLGEALVALEADRMAVPGHLASALGALLALFRRAQ